MDETQEKSITITRIIAAPAEEIFAAWTDPALLEQWQAEQVEFEPFAGGSFRFETSDEEEPGTVHVVTGEVLAFEQDRRLVERWSYGEADALADSILTVTFADKGNGRTEVALVEESEEHADPQSRIFSIEAWNAALEELAELLE